MCFTKGQWLHIKTTSSPAASFKSSNETSFPWGSGSRKDGAFVPRGVIVEGVSGMEGSSVVPEIAAPKYDPGSRMQHGRECDVEQVRSAPGVRSVNWQPACQLLIRLHSKRTIRPSSTALLNLKGS